MLPLGSLATPWVGCVVVSANSNAVGKSAVTAIDVVVIAVIVVKVVVVIVCLFSLSVLSVHHCPWNLPVFNFSND